MQVFKPAKARGKLPEDLEDPNLVGEEKFDGSRYIWCLGEDPYGRHEGGALLSKRESSKDGLYVDKTFNVPQITNRVRDKDKGHVFDGEVYIPGKDFYTMMGAMNSLPEEAVRRQREIGHVHFMVFDILQFLGTDVRQEPFEQRRGHLEDIFEDPESIFQTHIHLIPQIHENFSSAFENTVMKGGEGLMLKRLDAAYDEPQAWIKMKKSFEVSLVVMGYVPGKGQYADQVGSLCLGVYIDGILTEVATAGGFDQAVRWYITARRSELLNTVVDVYTEGMTSGLRLRHPTFYRFRSDVNANECTLEKLKHDLELQNAKPLRSR